MVTPLSKYIADKTPKFNEKIMEGLTYHKFKDCVEYLDSFIRYVSSEKTSTHLKYQGYRYIGYKEFYKSATQNKTRIRYDVAKNSLFTVEFMFHYGNEMNYDGSPKIRSIPIMLPYVERGNVMYIAGTNYVAMPMLCDKVISVGNKIIFVNIMTGKYSFMSAQHPFKCDDKNQLGNIIHSKFYKNESSKFKTYSRAYHTVANYLLAVYGFDEFCRRMLGTVPIISLDDIDDPNLVKFSSHGTPPHGYSRPKSEYTPFEYKLYVERDKVTPFTMTVMANLFYIFDNFPTWFKSIENIKDPYTYERILGLIIHTDGPSIAYVNEKIRTHFKTTILPELNPLVKEKLKSIGVKAETLLDLSEIIFKNFNNWVTSETTDTIYRRKTFETELNVLSPITRHLTLIFLDINKEEMKEAGDGKTVRMLDEKEVNDIFKKHSVTRVIYQLRGSRNNASKFMTNVEYSGDHLYPKNTAMVAIQESDFVSDKSKNQGVDADKLAILASYVTVGSILGLTKKKINPLVRVNPYVEIDDKTNEVLPPSDPHIRKLVEEAEIELTKTVADEEISYDAARYFSDDEIDNMLEELDDDIELDIEDQDLDEEIGS